MRPYLLFVFELERLPSETEIKKPMPKTQSSDELFELFATKKLNGSKPPKNPKNTLFQ